MRFVCAGDLHIGAGADLHPEGLDYRLLDQEAVLRQIVDAANELEAPLLWAGDAWERRRPTPAEILVVRRQFARLQHGAIVIPGNHDVEAFERPTGYDLLEAGVITAAAPGFQYHDGWSIAYLPWAPPARLVALEDGDRDTVNQRLAEGLLEIARGLYAQMDPSYGPKILLAHWSVSGAALPAGLPTDQLREPVIDLAGLKAIGFDAIVLGHIHRPQLLSAGGQPPIFYVGSPMPLNFGETSTGHGAWLLDTDSGAFQIPIASTPLITIEAGWDTELEGLSWPAVDVAGTVVKMRIHASQEHARRIDQAEVRRKLIEEHGARHVWAIQIEVERDAVVAGAPEIDESIDDLEALRLWLEQADFDPDESTGIRTRHAEYVQAAR